MASEKLRLSDLGRVFEDLRRKQEAGDVPDEAYDAAVERSVKKIAPRSEPMTKPSASEPQRN